VSGRAPTDEARAFTWVAFADHLDKPAEGLIDRIAKARPALVVDIGDVVFESKTDEFSTVKRLILDPLTKVGTRFYPVAGNHDFPVQPHWFEFWAPPANKLYYSFDYGNSHFIILDTNRVTTPEVQQFKPGTEEYAIQT
jgi:predicted phosphodiesterase